MSITLTENVAYVDGNDNRRYIMENIKRGSIIKIIESGRDIEEILSVHSVQDNVNSLKELGATEIISNVLYTDDKGEIVIYLIKEI